MDDQNIFSLVRRLENNFVNGTTNLSKYVDFSLNETLDTIDAYKNSKHTSGLYDSQGREKPFFNIVTAAINIWYRATDIDRKNIRVRATKKTHWMTALIATIHLQDWMRRSDFGQFLNDWGNVLSAYSSAIVKFVEKGGELIPAVMPWQRMIVDAVDIESNPIIEKLYYTPSQLLRNKAYNQEMVRSLLDSRKAREAVDGQTKDNLSDYIEVYEIHGELPLSWITDNEDDEYEFVQQMHVISFVEEDGGKFNDFTLYSGKEAKSPYMVTHLKKEDGRAIGIGAVELLFDAQWMQNHSIKNMKDQLDLASKLIFQTSDQGYLGRNVLTAIEQGDILVHALNQPLTQINNGSHDIGSLQAFTQQWKANSQELTSTPDALRGTTPVSGTPLGTTELLSNQGQSLFELFTENKGLALERMLRTYIIPYLKKKMDTSDEIAAVLESHDIKQIDSQYVPVEAMKRVNDKFLNQLFASIDDRNPLPEDPQAMMAVEQGNIQAEQSSLGNARYFVPSEDKKVKWKDIFKDLEWDLQVEVTNEVVDKQATLQTLFQMLQLSSQDPQRFQLIFNKMAEETGVISPIELGSQSQPQMQGAQPALQGNPQASPPQGNL